MNKIFKIFFLSLFFLSCSIQKQEYKLTSTVINRLKNPFSGTKIYFIDIVDSSYVLDKNFIDLCKAIKKREYEGVKCADCSTIIWEDKLNPWGYTDNDLEFISKEIEKNKKIKWNINKLKIKVNKINISKLPSNNSKEEIENERMKRIKTENYLYIFSTPIFTKNKNIAIVSYKNVYLNSGETLIYKKIKDDWILIGEVQ